MTALRLTLPPSTLDLHPPPTEPASQTLSVYEEKVVVALKAFRPSSAGGVDGLRPGHLKDFGHSTSSRDRTAFVEDYCQSLFKNPTR